MALMKSIYHLSILHVIITCIVLVAFSIGFSLVFFLEDDEGKLIDFSEYDDKITFWNSDFDTGPINDLKYFLTPLGVRFVDKSLSSDCGLTRTCAKNLHILSPSNGMNPNKGIKRRFYEYYKNDPLMKRIDAFVCFHPPAMCELFMPFNRTIIIIASTRYELGRFSVDEWNQWNKNLRTIASNSRNIVAASNLYDAEYIKYFTGINTTLLPLSCIYTDIVYRPSNANREYIFIALNENSHSFTELFLDELNLSIKKLNASISIKYLNESYKSYGYSKLARHPAIIYLPSQVSTIDMLELYSMNIPLYFPSLDLLSEWHLKYNLVYKRTWDKVLTGVSKNHSAISSYYVNSTIPDPNNEYDYSSIYYWLKFADFYQWPHIIYFNSFEDLTSKLINTNLTLISEQMSEYSHKKKLALLEQWKTILHGISTSLFFLEKKHSE